MVSLEEIALLHEWLGRFILPFFRVSGMIMIMPIIGSALVPMRARLMLALAVSLVMVPVLADIPTPELSALTWLTVIEQVLIGMAIGFVLKFLVEIFVVGGQMISNQMGLGFASFADPANGTTVVILSKIYSFMVSLMFLAMDGHLMMFSILKQSFEMLPIGVGAFDFDVAGEIAYSASVIFSSALLMAFPCVIALLIVNFAFGVMTKAAPQLNVFAIGFPFTMLFGLLVVFVSVGSLGGFFVESSELVFALIRQVAGNG